MNDIEFLAWIRDRLVSVHGEDIHMDYMRRFNRIIDAMPTPPVPQYEDVEVVAWQCPTCKRLYSDREHSKTLSACCDIANEQDTLVKLTGTYRREVKKVKRREEITMSDSAEWRSIHDDSKIPEDTSEGHFFYEWEE